MSTWLSFFINLHHYTGITLLSVNPQHNGQKFTDKSPENADLSVKCVLLTDKTSKMGSLSVNSNEILVKQHCI